MSPKLAHLIVVATGGALGAVSRYAVSGWVQGWAGARFPWGTLCVNLLGCFLLGFLAGRWERATAPASWRLLWGVGFLGAFTTYSTFALETGTMLRDGAWTGAGAYTILHVALGLVAVFAGLMAARLS
jgi:CrcB protein